MPNVIDVLPQKRGPRVSPGRSHLNGYHAHLSRVFIGQAFNIEPDVLLSDNRGSRAVCHARQIAMYLAHVVFSVPLTHVATAFGRDRSTAYHACKVIELKRDDHHFDRLLCHLEKHLQAAADGEF